MLFGTPNLLVDFQTAQQKANKMYKVLVVLSVFLAIALADDHYTTKYDGINLDEILNNDRLYNGYANCLLEKGTCSQDGAELKKIIPEALEQDCAKCNEKQRAGAKKVLRFTFKNKKDIFDQLEAKYDPKKQFRGRYREEAEKEGIKI